MAGDFAERLKSVRALRGLTQNELGELAGLPNTSIAHFETNTRKPSFDTLWKLSKALEVSTDYLLGTIDEPKASESGNVLLRDYEKLPAHDRELLRNIAAMMVEQRRKDDSTRFEKKSVVLGEGSMKKAMISQPMAGKSEAQIRLERQEAVKFLEVGGYEVVDTVFPDCINTGNAPLKFLAKSIMAMADVDAVYFMKDWATARGCKIEHRCCVDYEVPFFIEGA